MGVLVAGLLARYDRNKDGKLSRAEAGLEPSAFDRLDRNGDGQLDAAELARWLEAPADLEVVVPLERGAHHVARVAGGPLAARVGHSRMGALLLRVRNWQIELVRGDGVPGGPPSFRASALAAFKGLDRDNNGYLDSKEVFVPPFRYVSLLRLADANGDGKVSRKEFTAFVELREKVHGTVTFLTLADRGRSLFELLDADHDGRLSQREMRTAWERLAPWASGGVLARGAVPRQFRLIVRQGKPPSGYASGLTDLAAFPRTVPRPGPLWFRKMDRNNDGDVSPSEFLGSMELFRRIDTNGDGLISVEEAERADKMFRKQAK
jgi:Ca2+-binding EF-hand superfamily protein